MRKYFSILVWVLLLGGSTFLHASNGTIQSLSNIPLRTVKAPAVSIETLSNGMKVYLLEDHELPIMQAFAYVRAGSIYDPPEQVGLASVLGSVLRNGGTLRKKVEEINKMLENEGASVETAMSNEYGSASLSCLSKDISSMLPLFFEILSSPRFEDSAIQLAIARKIEALKRINDEPEKIAVREFPKLLYGKESIWARTPTIASLQSVRKSDLQKYHRQFYHPDRLTLAISGDFEKEEMLALLEKSTQGWSQSDAILPQIPSVEKKWEKGIYLMNKPGGQSTMLVGHYGDKRSNPDKFALILMNYMLGGDIFSSKLGEQIRSNRGLAYSIYSHFGLESDYGLFYAMAQTKTSSTVEVISLIQQIIAEFQEGKGFNANSLAFAKASILNQLMGDWDPRFGYVKERARLSYFGYPEDYLDFFQKKLSGVNLEQVKKVVRQYLFPEKLKILVVGDEAEIKTSLDKLGTVREIPLPSL